MIIDWTKDIEEIIKFCETREDPWSKEIFTNKGFWENQPCCVLSLLCEMIKEKEKK